MTDVQKRATVAVRPIVNDDKSAVIGMEIAFATGQKEEVWFGGLDGRILNYATYHGLKQKAVDSAAISRDPETGRPATVAAKVTAVMKTITLLRTGSWFVARKGEGSGTGGLLFQALVRMFEGKKTADEVREFLAGKTKAEQSALRRNPKIASIIEDIRAEQVDTEGVDSDAMLDELAGE